jgi:hypothetical protein
MIVTLILHALAAIAVSVALLSAVHATQVRKKGFSRA